MGEKMKNVEVKLDDEGFEEMESGKEPENGGTGSSRPSRHQGRTGLT